MATDTDKYDTDGETLPVNLTDEKPNPWDHIVKAIRGGGFCNDQQRVKAEEKPSMYSVTNAAMKMSENAKKKTEKETPTVVSRGAISLADPVEPTEDSNKTEEAPGLTEEDDVKTETSPLIDTTSEEPKEETPEDNESQEPATEKAPEPKLVVLKKTPTEETSSESQAKYVVEATWEIFVIAVLSAFIVKKLFMS